jgi:hypothetical protein
MGKTPDAFAGPSFEEAVIWDEEISDPVDDRRLQYVQNKGLVVRSDGAVRSVGETREAIWQAEVDDIDIDDPPGSPSPGGRVIVGDSPTGAFVGHSGEIAQWTGSEWVFTTPRQGTTAYVKSENVPYRQTETSAPWAWLAALSMAATEVGQMIYSWDGILFYKVKPLISDRGITITDDDGHIVVVETS